MASPSHPPVGHLAGDFQQWIPDDLVKPIPLAMAAFVLILTITVSLSASLSDRRDIPLVNPPKSIFQTNLDIKREFLRSADATLQRARSLYQGRPFRMFTHAGIQVVVPYEMANEIRNMPQLAFMQRAYDEFHGDIPGFQGITNGARADNLLVNVIRKPLTKSLSKVTAPLADEVNRAVYLNLGDSTEWQDVKVYGALLDIVSRASSRVFLGEELCRNTEWLRITKTYASLSFNESIKLLVVPRLLRPLVHWFIPTLKKLRTLLVEAEAMVRPILEARRKLKAEAAAKGKPIPTFNDGIEWAESESSGSPYDAAIFQLNLSVAAIHTTTDLISRVLLNLADRPDVIKDLREEVTEVLRSDGWQKTSLYKMKKLDSAIKESQRLKPISSTTMRRLVTSPVTLSDGTSLKAGDWTIVDSSRGMRDPAIYENPDTYDPYRYLRWRDDPAKENLAHLVSTGPASLGFGHGEHACPGRFFAANEVKVILCHVLLQYDWKPAPDTVREPIPLGFSLGMDPNNKLMFRRRANPEFDIESI